ncbi:MAG: ATP-binding protein [Stenotrophobium sp.]
MNSLRTQLIVWLFLALTVVGAASSVLAYGLALGQTQALLDYQMEQIAVLLGAQSESSVRAAQIDPRPALAHESEDDFVISIRDADRSLLYISNPQVMLPPLSVLGFHGVSLAGKSYRVFTTQSGAHTISVAQLVKTRREMAASAAMTELLPVAILIPVLYLVLLIVIRRQLRPLRETASEVAGRSPLSLDPLLTGDLPDELRPLIDEINRLLGRLSIAMQQEKRFIADAAHALRTPLAALQLQVDVLDGSSDADESRTRLAELRDGMRRFVQLTDHLLTLSHAASDVSPITVSTDLDVVLRETIALYQSAAEAKRVGLQADARAAVAVPGDMRLLMLVIGNLLDNALRHTPPRGTITLRTTTVANQAHVEILDEGPGLADAELEKVFERFYRAPGDATTGSGLGLSTVRSIVTRLGGTITLRNRKDCTGLLAQVSLPQRPPSAAAAEPDA